MLATEKKEYTPLFIPTRESGKLYKVDDHIMTSVSGVVADATYLVDCARVDCQRHLYSHKTPAYVETVVKAIADQMHVYTQFGSSRPYGVSLMYAGFDKVSGFQLYNSDPSGNFSAWKAYATGKNSVAAISTLKDDYVEGCSVKEGLVLAMKVLQKAMDTAMPEPKKFEIGVVTRHDKQVV